MRPFRERNPVAIGAVGIAVVLCLLLAAFNVQKLPVIGGGTVYSATFTEAGGLATRDEVRVAGVKVGEVEQLSLEGQHVRVDFRVQDDAWLGDRTGAAIKVKTLLGEKYLALFPAGTHALRAKDQIPTSRTVAPYDVIEAFSGLTRTVDRIDVKELANAFDTVSATFANTPPEVRASLRGLTRLSQTIAKRDDALRTLLRHARGVSKVLADRDGELVRLLKDGDKVLKAVHARRAVIHQLLVNTVLLSSQLTALVDENRAQLQPALRHLADVVAVLQENENNLDRSIRSLATFVKLFGNVVGTGRWFDAYIQNLVPLPPSVTLPQTPVSGLGLFSGAKTSGKGAGG